jgi:hypothetical protein
VRFFSFAEIADIASIVIIEHPLKSKFLRLLMTGSVKE